MSDSRQTIALPFEPPTVREILALLKYVPLSAREIVAKLAVNGKPAYLSQIHRALRGQVERGVVESLGGRYALRATP